MPAIPTVVIRARSSAVGCRRALAVLALSVSLGAAPALAADRPITVAYVSSGAVYLDAGRAEGLVAGTVVRVMRGAEKIADLEVAFVADHSSSCKVVDVAKEIQKGDRVVVVSAPAAAGEQVPPPPAPEATTPVEPPVVVDSSRSSYQFQPRVAHMKTYGSVAIGYRTFSTSGGPSSNESNGRLSLRLSEIGGRPLELRLRMRARRISRDGYGASVETTQRSDRLYEASLSWEPEDSRFSLQLGRLGAGPFLALGYLDGLLAQFRLSRHLFVGAFGGARPDITDLGFQTAGTKYGGFLRLASNRDGVADAEAFYGEVVLGGITEKARNGDISRDYVTLESRLGSGTRWWLYERAEVDLNRGWRKELTGSTSQVSNAALSASVRMTSSVRATLSYDQRRNYLTYETRPLPEEDFTRYFREGARASIDWQSHSGWSASLGAGLERADDVDQPTNSAYLSLLDANAFGLPWLIGGDGSFYSGGTVEGWVVNLRTSWAFRGGHDLGLTIGGSQTKLSGTFGSADPRNNQWARISGTLRLPMRLYLYGEYEYDTGDDLEGNHAVLELGYRF
jgi:hypothetical protein